MAGTVEEYLKELKFKRRFFGGVDEESVLVHIRNICDLYAGERQAEREELEASRKELEELEASRKELEEKADAYAGLQTELEKARESIRELEEERERAREQAEKEKEAAWEMKAQQEREYKEFTDILETIQSVKKEAIVKAQTEAAKEGARLRGEIMAKVEEKRREAEDEKARLRREVEHLQQCRDALRYTVRTEGENFMTRIRQMEKIIGTLKEQAETLEDEEPAKGEFTALPGNKSGGNLNVG